MGDFHKNHIKEIIENHGSEKTIDCLENKFKGEDIYIIASGKSCDFIEPSFFENKLVIGVNLVYKRFPVTFLIRKELKLMKQMIDLEEKAIHIVSVGDCGGANTFNKKYLDENPLDHMFYFYHQNNGLQNITLPVEKQLIVSFSTITSAIHFAAFLGAKNIILLGHDCGKIDGESNFNGYREGGTPANYENWYSNWLKQIEAQTIWTKKYVKEKYDANVYSLNPFINFGLEGHKYN